MATEQNIKDGHRYLVQLSIKQDHYLFNMWDYVESVKTLKEAEKLRKQKEAEEKKKREEAEYLRLKKKFEGA